MTECRVVLKDIMLDKNLKFINHTVIIADRRNKFTCYICMAKFATENELSEHKSLHSGTDTEPETEDDLFDEEVERAAIKSKPSPCTSAQKQKLKMNSIEISETHQKVSDNLSTDKREENVSSENNKITLETPFKCDTCQVFFKTGDDAKFHKRSNKCRFSCKICRRKFNTLYAFVVHVMQHKSNTEKTITPAQYAYICTLCERLFDDCYQLRRHESMTHNIKPSRTLKTLDSPVPPLQYFKQQESTDKNCDLSTSQVTEEVTSVLNASASVGEENEIICDLCYDVFNTQEELKSHVDFHKQLEKKSDSILIEDDEEEIEVVEDNSDPHDVRATIKSIPVLKPPKSRTSKNTYATLTPFYADNGPKQKSKVKDGSKESNKPAVSNQVLTASITDMLTPTHEKQYKTILLKDMAAVPVSRFKKTLNASLEQITSSGTNDNMELRQTGPLSYSFIYKESTKGSPKSKRTNTRTDNDSTVTSLSKTVPTEPIPSSTSLLKANTDLNNYNFIITDLKESESSAAISSPNIAPNTSAVTNFLPMMTSSASNNNQIVQNVSTSAHSVSPSYPSSSATNTNITYVINPTNNSASSPQISIASAPLTFTNSTTRIAYIIIPQGANIAPSTVQPAKANRSDSTEVGTANVSTISSNLTEKRAESAVTIPGEESNTEPIQQPMGNTHHPNEDSSLSVSKNDKSYDMQVPLITSVTSLHGASNGNESTSPMITNLTSVISEEENSKNSNECVTFPNTSATTITTASNNKSISSYMISTPGPSTQSEDIIITIDSDSSRDSTDDKSEPTKKKSGTESADEDGLIIDEDPKEGLIFVKKLTELMEPQIAQKEINQDKTADKGQKNTDNEQNTADNEQRTADIEQTKEKKWKFPMNCDGCSVVFQRYRAMRNHNERKLKCTLCDFRCCKVVDLKEHYILDHRKFFCGRCSFLASSKNRFKEHNSAKHTCKNCNGLYANLAGHVCSAQKEKKRENKNST